MTPAPIQRLLDRLRFRERSLALSWLAARGIACCFGLLVVACLLDFVIDRRVETPYPLRVTLLVVQVVTWLSLLVLLLLTLTRRRTDDDLALTIEEQSPDLGHRLISALQLNRAGAKTAGMSPDLIAAVTRQAEEQAAAIDLAKVSDGKRWRWSLYVIAGVAGVVGALASDTAAALVKRVFLRDVEIPRAFHLAATNPTIWPYYEEGYLRFEVTGAVPGETTVGQVRLDFDLDDSMHLELRHEAGNVWAARVPALDTGFTYRAWLADVRLRTPGVVRYEPRPVVQSIQTTVLLPEKLLGRRPSGAPYEEAQRAGDLDYRMDGCKARLALDAQMPLESGAVEVQGKQPRRVPLAIADAHGSVEFDLLPGDFAYVLHLRNRFGFANADPPRRTIRRLPLDAPEVALLPETFWKAGDDGPPEDREVEGIPLLLGERFALAYRASDRYGISHVRLRYRVLPRSTSLDEEAGRVDRDAFLPLPLGPARGAKEPPSPKAREEFATNPPPNPDSLPDTDGGGRYDFSSAGIPDSKGGLLTLKEGDRIQFYVEAFSKADPDGSPGRSAVREKEVVDVKAYLSWLQKKDDLKERTRTLEEQQRAARPDSSDR